VWGNRETAVELKRKTEEFLKKELKVELSFDKLGITHAGTEKAEFLGFDISSPTPKESFFEKGSVKKRASHVRIVIEAPYEKLKQKLVDRGFLTLRGTS
jgi:hypothetical protein